MTTVVVHNNTVYADGQATGNFISSKKTKKILNLGTAIVAGAGRWSHVVKFQNWIADTLSSQEVQELNPHITVSMPEKMVAEDFEGLVLYPDGVVIRFEGCDNSFEVEQPVFLGSGGELAAGCMFGCGDGYKAVEAAIELDPFSGGEIQVETFDEPEEELTKESLSGLSKEEILTKIFGDDSIETVKEETTTLTEHSHETTEVVTSEPEENKVVYVSDDLSLGDDYQIIFKGCMYPSVQNMLDSGNTKLTHLANLLVVPFAHNIGYLRLLRRVEDKIKKLVDNHFSK